MQEKTPIIIEKLKLDITPYDLYCYLKDLPYSFFLDSSLSSISLGRFSFIGVEPFLIFSSKNNRICIKSENKKRTFVGNPFSLLKKIFNRFKIDNNISLPFPFIGGGVGYFSYDLKNFTEKLKRNSLNDTDIPDSMLCFYDVVIVFDNLKKEFFIISSGFPKNGKERYLRQKHRLEYIKNKIEISSSPKETLFKRNEVSLNKKNIIINSNFTKETYLKAIKKAKEYIRKGDIYQVNLSQRFEIKPIKDLFNIYGILRTINPAPFSSFLSFKDIRIASSSPERFLMKKGRRLETRPIKGTRPRGKDEKEDNQLKKQLLTSAKDRAENLMIIDLERNDLGRICEYGSIGVKGFMECEDYATLFHLVSTVEGRTMEGVGPIDCLINCFPGGSITGAPKIRSMEIIEELEPVKRSIYTGSIGYIGFNGDMDTSIVIRTIIEKDGIAYFNVGGGIVHDSIPEREYNETLDKAKALFDAVQIASSDKVFKNNNYA
jgi:para-aminobenzoate synthetase component I